jgi:hypothetical protein
LSGLRAARLSPTQCVHQSENAEGDCYRPSAKLQIFRPHEHRQNDHQPDEFGDITRHGGHRFFAAFRFLLQPKADNPGRDHNHEHDNAIGNQVKPDRSRRARPFHRSTASVSLSPRLIFTEAIQSDRRRVPLRRVKSSPHRACRCFFPVYGIRAERRITTHMNPYISAHETAMMASRTTTDITTSVVIATVHVRDRSV